MWVQGNQRSQAYLQDSIDYLAQVAVVGESSGLRYDDGPSEDNMIVPEGYAGDIAILAYRGWE